MMHDRLNTRCVHCQKHLKALDRDGLRQVVERHLRSCQPFGRSVPEDVPRRLAIRYVLEKIGLVEKAEQQFTPEQLGLPSEAVPEGPPMRVTAVDHDAGTITVESA